MKRILIMAALALVPACTPSDGLSDPPVDPASIDLDNKADGEANIWSFMKLMDWARAQPRELLYDDPWTNWTHDVKPLALVKLAVMRRILDKNNLFDAHPPGVRSGFLPASYRCPEWTQTARTVEGACNDLDDPGMGAAGVRFGHNVPLASVRAESDASLLSPNPREISRKLLARASEAATARVDFLNMLAAAWVQFMIHDWFSHGDNRTDAELRVPLAADDPLRRHGVTELRVQRTKADPTRTSRDDGLPVTHVNEVTHWWDGSQLYGSDAATANRLRSFSGGKLALDARGLLPVARDGFEDTGFRRNWWIGLSLMHTLFAREHNAIATMLADRHPDWDDQELFDVARLINAAVMAKIHTVEWTPAILKNDSLLSGMKANWWGLFHWLEHLGISFDDPILFGIVGNSRELHGVPYSLTEEFVSVYRMHPLLPESLELRRHDTGGSFERVSTAMTRNGAARALTERVSMADLFYSFATMHPGSLTLHNYPRFLQDLALPGLPAFDMGTVDIVRDRERGVPRYNEFRRRVALKPIASFADLTDDDAIVRELQAVYGGDVERLDLMVGCLAEAHRPAGFGFGETAFQIFTLMATRRLHADRFFTDDYTADVYTEEGLEWVEDATMRRVILRHLPELEGRLADVDNAFAPW